MNKRYENDTVFIVQDIHVYVGDNAVFADLA